MNQEEVLTDTVNIMKYLKLVFLGALFFALIGSLSSCKTTQHVQYNKITPNTQHINEGEYIQQLKLKKRLTTNLH